MHHTSLKQPELQRSQPSSTYIENISAQSARSISVTQHIM